MLDAFSFNDDDDDANKVVSDFCEPKGNLKSDITYDISTCFCLALSLVDSTNK